jgi:O-antigen/teichoic acid export membrane protein
MSSLRVGRGRGAATSRARWWSAQPTLVKTTASLLSTTGITALLGLVFWWLAARTLSVAALGYGSAAVSALMLVGTFGMAGLNTVLLGQLARRPPDAAGLLTAALCASGLISAGLAGGFLLIGTEFVPRAAHLYSGAEAALFIVGAALTGVTLVLDEALLGLLGGSVQLWRNATFAVAKLAALAGLVMLWHEWKGTSILLAWIVGTALSMLPAMVLLARRGVRLTAAPQWRALRRLGRASVSNTWLNNTLQVPRLALPILVTWLLSAPSGGAFYIAWSIAILMSLVPTHLTTALFAVGAADPRGLAAKARFTLRICLLGGLVGVPVVVLCAHQLLRLFGSAYATRATLPLQVLAVGYFGSVLKAHFIALCRIFERTTLAAVFASAGNVVRLAAAVAGALVGGLVGLSVALVAVMCAEGLVVSPVVWAALHGRMPVRRAHRVHRQTGTTGRPPPSRNREGESMPGRPARSRPVRVCYHIQTHTRPEQVTRLVEVIKQGSPGSAVLISHDAAGAPLDVMRLEAMPGVHVLVHAGGYGGFSHIDRFFAAVDWLEEHGVEYDWLENITGQDFPLRPIAEIERAIAELDVDGYLLYAPIFPDRTPPGADHGAAPGFEFCIPRDAFMRYGCRSWWFGRPTPAKQRWLRPLMALNFTQPWVRLSLAYCTIGLRRRRTVFSDDFIGYGGWFFCTLSEPCVRYVRDFARDNPEIVAFFRTVLGPEEVFLQTVLVNSGKFRFEPDSKRYIDMSQSRNNHSKKLGVADLDLMLASGAHWARKFDRVYDAEVLDILERHIHGV